MKSSFLFCHLLFFRLVITFFSDGLIAQNVSSPPGLTYVTLRHYAAFLNDRAQEDPYGFYDEKMGEESSMNGIMRSGPPGNYTYSFREEEADEAMASIDFFSALCFYDWSEEREQSYERDELPLSSLTHVDPFLKSNHVEFFLTNTDLLLLNHAARSSFSTNTACCIGTLFLILAGAGGAYYSCFNRLEEPSESNDGYVNLFPSRNNSAEWHEVVVQEDLVLHQQQPGNVVHSNDDDNSSFETAFFLESPSLSRSSSGKSVFDQEDGELIPPPEALLQQEISEGLGNGILVSRESLPPEQYFQPKFKTSLADLVQKKMIAASDNIFEPYWNLPDGDDSSAQISDLKKDLLEEEEKDFKHEGLSAEFTSTRTFGSNVPDQGGERGISQPFKKFDLWSDFSEEEKRNFKQKLSLSESITKKVQEPTPGFLPEWMCYQLLDLPSFEAASIFWHHCTTETPIVGIPIKTVIKEKGGNKVQSEISLTFGTSPLSFADTVQIESKVEQLGDNGYLFSWSMNPKEQPESHFEAYNNTFLFMPNEDNNNQTLLRYYSGIKLHWLKKMAASSIDVESQIKSLLFNLTQAITMSFYDDDSVLMEKKAELQKDLSSLESAK